MIDIEERNLWDRSQNLLLIGPGGAGKSTVGPYLAPLLNYHCVDLDQQFGCRIGNISKFIKSEGYEQYKVRNSLLAESIVSASRAPTLLITSSGFLTPDNPPRAIEANKRIMAKWHSICLLPSRDMERAVGVIVDRQAQRSFSRDQVHEESTIRARYPIYAREGDMIVFSELPPEDIAEAVARRLTGYSLSPKAQNAIVPCSKK